MSFNVVDAPSWKAKVLAQRFEYAWAFNGRWDANGLVAEKLINQTKGDLVEFGGPTVSRSPEKFIYDTALLRPILVTSGDYLNPPQKAFIARENFRVRTADVTKMPFADESLAGVFATALPYAIWPQYLTEANRTLTPGGLVVMQGVKEKTIEQLISLKYRPIRAAVSNICYLHHPVDYDVIFQKPYSSTRPLKR